MTRRSRARCNRRIEAVDVDRDVIALAGRDPFEQPGSTQASCLVFPRPIPEASA
jgi:hypothetical protein